LTIRPSPEKLEMSQSNFQNEYRVIFVVQYPPCGSFRYFIVLIDASTRWSHISLLSTRK